MSANETQLGRSLPPGPDAAPPRAALLARPGPARDNLRAALQQAGAHLVLEDDPSLIDARALLEAAPQVVLVALDAATEDAISRLDQVLHDPAVTVLYDEADLAAAREGWEAQRWTRHLVAKLHGHRDVLPPGTESEFEGGQAPDPLDWPGMEAAQGAPALSALQAGAQGDEHPAGLDQAGLYQDLEPEAWKPRELPDPDAVLIDAFDALPPLEMEPAAVAGPGPGAVPATAPAADAAVEVPAPPATERPRMTLELEAIEAAGSLEGARGALLLFAGIGGPDAVRKVLAELPPDLPTPVLVSLRLDGGRYDNLVKQMARVTDLPVELAKPGDPALAGHVFVLPDDVSTAVNNGVVVFAEGAPDLVALVASLPPPQTAILLLSGSEEACVEPSLALAAKGAFVAGQTPQGCYDPAAAKALLARGGEVGTPDELATRVIAHLAP